MSSMGRGASANFYRITVAWLLAAGLPVLLVILLILPATFFDTGPPLCLSRLFFDIECYGCGMTRGVMHLIHGELDTALSYHKLSVVVTPVLVGAGIYEWMQSYKRLRQFYKNRQQAAVNA